MELADDTTKVGFGDYLKGGSSLGRELYNEVTKRISGGGTSVARIMARIDSQTDEDGRLVPTSVTATTSILLHLAEADITEWFGEEGNTTRGATTEMIIARAEWKRDFVLKFREEAKDVRKILQERCEPDLYREIVSRAIGMTYWPNEEEMDPLHWQYGGEPDVEYIIYSFLVLNKCLRSHVKSDMIGCMQAPQDGIISPQTVEVQMEQVHRAINTPYTIDWVIWRWEGSDLWKRNMIHQGWSREEDPRLLVSMMQRVWMHEKRLNISSPMPNQVAVKQAVAGSPTNDNKSGNQVRLCLICTKFAMDCIMSPKSGKDLPKVEKHECSGELPFAYIKSTYLNCLKFQRKMEKSIE